MSSVVSGAAPGGINITDLVWHVARQTVPAIAAVVVGKALGFGRGVSLGPAALAFIGSFAFGDLIARFIPGTETTPIQLVADVVGLYLMHQALPRMTPADNLLFLGSAMLVGEYLAPWVKTTLF